ncbi:MAG TPA: TonB-dependent receptor [Nannocystaceae bacterium]|nr:TonB-dependent receptor [Nannocystaceae bacterium]
MAAVWTSVAAIALAAALSQEPTASAEAPTEEQPLIAAPTLEEAAPLDRSASTIPQPKARGRVRGRVMRYGEREPVPGARVIPRTGGEAVVADDAGNFLIELGPGVHRFVIRAPGYEDLETTVRLERNQELEFEYRLSPLIEGQRYRTVVRQRREVAISATTLREAEIREVPGSRGDPLRVISSLPGAVPLAGFLPYVVVRGAAPGNTGYYLDGSRVPILFHVALGPSVLHPYFIDAVDFYPGGAPVRLGRYVSGIIEARTRAARRDRVHGDVDIRFTDAGGLLEIPINRSYLSGCKEKRKLKCKRGPGKGALTLAGRYSYTGALLTLVQSTAVIKFWDYQARFDHALNDRADLTMFAFGSYDNVGQKPEKNPETGEVVKHDPFVRFQFHRIDTRIRQRLRNEGSAVYAVVLGVDQAGVTKFKTNEWRIAPRIDVRLPLNDRVTLGFGVDQEFQIFRLATPLNELGDLNPEDIGFLFNDRFVSATAGYFEVLYKKGDFEMRPGIRVDAYAQVGSSPYLPTTSAITTAVGVDPRITFRERVHPRVVLRQALGLYHQPPSFPIPVPGLESFGFERGLQQNAQGSFGYELELVRDRLQLTQEAYLGYLSNLQDYELSQASEDQPVEELEDVITQVTGWAYGLETMLKLDPELRMFGWAAYTLARSTRNYEVGGHAPSNWDQRHILNVVLGYRISDKWNFGGRVHYHTGRPWTAPIDDQSTLDALSQNRNNARLPAFFQLDLRVERNWRFPNWQLDLFLDVTNATYSREIFQCTANDNSIIDDATPRAKMAFAAAVDPSKGIAKCTPQGFRYVVPSLGMRGRF